MTSIGWIPVKFCTAIHHHYVFGDPLTFPRVPTWSWHFCLCVKYLYLTFGWIVVNFCTEDAQRMMNANDFDDPLIFPVAPPACQNVLFVKWNISTFTWISTQFSDSKTNCLYFVVSWSFIWRHNEVDFWLREKYLLCCHSLQDEL